MEKTLIDKFIDGEISQEQFDAETSKLSPEAQVALNKEAAEKLPTAVEKLINVRRGIEKVTPPAIQSEDFGKKLRDEHFEQAKSDFYSQFGIEKDEDRKSFEEGFKKFDSGKVDVANIIKDMKSYYVSTKPDEFLDLAKEKRQREQEAEDLNAQNAGTNGGGGNGGDATKKVSKEVKAYMDASAKQGITLTPEEAARNLEIGKRGGKISTF